MARPTNKQDLTIAANNQFEKLCTMIDSMPEEKHRQHFLLKTGIRIYVMFLIHLYERHQFEQGMRLTSCPILTTGKPILK